MDEKIYYSAEDIVKMLGVSIGKAYKILREMNKDLASKGFLTIAGKIPVEYFKEKRYDGAKGECMSCNAKKDPNGQYRWTDWIAIKKKLQKGDLRQRKKQKNDMYISCYSDRRI